MSPLHLAASCLGAALESCTRQLHRGCDGVVHPWSPTEHLGIGVRHDFDMTAASPKRAAPHLPACLTMG